VSLIVGRGIVHGKDVQDHGGALWDCVLPNLDILQGFAHHQRRHAVHALSLLHSMQSPRLYTRCSLQTYVGLKIFKTPRQAPQTSAQAHFGAFRDCVPPSLRRPGEAPCCTCVGSPAQHAGMSLMLNVGRVPCTEGRAAEVGMCRVMLCGLGASHVQRLCAGMCCRTAHAP